MVLESHGNYAKRSDIQVKERGMGGGGQHQGEKKPQVGIGISLDERFTQRGKALLHALSPDSL